VAARFVATNVPELAEASALYVAKTMNIPGADKMFKVGLSYVL
jgi:hypothetical protein